MNTGKGSASTKKNAHATKGAEITRTLPLGRLLIAFLLVFALLTACGGDEYDSEYDDYSDEATSLPAVEDEEYDDEEDGSASEEGESTVPLSSGGTYALIYNGPVAAEYGPEAVAALAAGVGLPVQYIDDIADLPTMLDDAAVFIIGGTEDDLDPLRDSFTPQILADLQDYLRSGGRYWGICGGAYIASTGWEEGSGFVEMLSIIPAVSYEFDENDEPQIISVQWFDETVPMYFQFGPAFELVSTSEQVNVFAYYDDGGIAGLISSYGHGKVAVTGPHPEAQDDWGDEVADVGDWEADPALGEDLLRILLSNDPVTP